MATARSEPSSGISAAKLLGSRAALALVGAALSVLSVIAIVGFLDSAAFASVVAEVLGGPELAVPFLALYSLAFWLRALAWQRLLSGRATVFGLFSILQATLFLNHVLPAKAGDAFRIYFLGRRGAATLGRSAATTLLARAIEFSSLVAVAGGAGLLAAGSLPGTPALFAVVVVVATVAFLAARQAVSWSGFVATKLPSGLSAFVHDTRDAIREVRPRDMAIPVAQTAVSWVLESVVVTVTCQAAGVDLGLSAAVAVTAGTLVFQVVPLTPGGLGIYEGSMTGLLALYGVPPEQGLVVATSAHALKFLYSYVVGGLFFLREGTHLARSSWAG